MPDDLPPSEKDGEKLIQLAKDKSSKGRTLLTTTIVELFSDDNHNFSRSEQLVMTEIIIQLVDNIEISVRTALAERLSNAPNVPRELAMHLVGMEAGVAFPILKTSNALRDPDLIGIIKSKTMEHQLAVSMRAMLPTSISRALAESEHDEVVKSLLENEGAQIDDRTFEGIVRRTTGDTIFNNAMVMRRDLPGHVANQLYHAVSEALRNYLVSDHNVDPESVDDAIAQIIPVIMEGRPDASEPSEDVATQVEAAINKGVLGDALVSLLRSVEIERFNCWFAAASRLREESIGGILYEEGGETLAAVCKAIGIDRKGFLEIFVLLRHGRLGDKQVPEGEVPRAAKYYSSIKPYMAVSQLKDLQGRA